MIFFNRKKHRYSATFKHKDIDYNGVTYELRELSVGERMTFTQFTEENRESVLLVYAYLISLSCRQFKGHDPSDLVMHISPGAITHIAEHILMLCGLNQSAVDDAEKKSESDQS